MSYAQRLIDGLVAEGTTLEPTGRPDEYLVTVYRGHPRANPCRFLASPQAVQRYVEAIAEDSTAVYPDLDPLEAGYRLMTVHIDEEVGADSPPMSAVWFEGGAIRATPLEGWVNPLSDLPPGDYRWTTERPDDLP